MTAFFFLTFAAPVSGMLERLQKKWKVKGLQLALIISTFAIGGSATGYIGKKIMNLLNIQPGWLWVAVYVLLVALIWPLMVLLISIPFGQYSFFLNYILKIGARLGIVSQHPPFAKAGGGKPASGIQHLESSILNPASPLRRIAIFASGAGSNAEKIIDHFRDNDLAKIALVVCNNPAAGVIRIAQRENIPVLLIGKERFLQRDAYVEELDKSGIDFIVLAGFLWKLPPVLIKKFPLKIINIHPALLPRYGGKGMYGRRVHEAVLAGGEKESGISIHYVDEIYDHGKIIFQATCPVDAADTSASLAEKVHALEHRYYAQVIETLLGN